MPETMPDGQPWPTITIVTPSYNQGQFLETGIRSVLLQGYPNFEYLIMDGGSTDASRAIIEKYQAWLTGWVSQKDGGQSEAINRGFTGASGVILHWLNSDDFLLPGALASVAAAWQRAPEAAAWVGGCYRVDSSRRVIGTVLPQNLTTMGIAHWWREGRFMQPACFINARTWSQAGPLDECLGLAFDLDLWLRLAVLGRFEPMSEFTAAAVIHEDAKTRAQRSLLHAETIAVQIRHGYPQCAEERLMNVVSHERGKGMSRTTVSRLSRSIYRAVVRKSPRHPRYV